MKYVCKIYVWDKCLLLKIIVLFLYRAISTKLNLHNYLSAVPYNMHCVVSNSHPV